VLRRKMRDKQQRALQRKRPKRVNKQNMLRGKKQSTQHKL